ASPSMYVIALRQDDVLRYAGSYDMRRSCWRSVARIVPSAIDTSYSCPVRLSTIVSVSEAKSVETYRLTLGRRRIVRCRPYPRGMAKPLEEWSIDELRAEAVRVADELARRAATPAPAGGRKPRTDVVRACENWVRGLAWDETFTLEMVDDEFSLHER